MALKFKKAEVKQQRLKVLVYGEMGSGKSTICCSLPNVAYIDTEDTSSKEQYAEAINSNGGAVAKIGDIDEIILQVKELMVGNHPYKTLVIDSLTIPYEKAASAAEKKVGSDFGKHTAVADKKVNDLVALLLDERFDMNVIVTAHSKREYGSGMTALGNTAVGPKRLGFAFDLVLETSVLGRNFQALVKKSRLKSFPTGEEVKFNYEELVRRCGVDSLEAAAKPLVFATPEQVKEIQRLNTVLNTPAETIEKWLEKAKCESFETMDTDTIAKCIEAQLKKMESK